MLFLFVIMIVYVCVRDGVRCIYHKNAKIFDFLDKICEKFKKIAKNWCFFDCFKIEVSVISCVSGWKIDVVRCLFGGRRY